LRSGRPEPLAVTAGLSDGTFVEIVGGDLEATDKVIVNEVNRNAKTRGGAPQNPSLRL